ncbi:MAG: phosphate ABC transporter substrate-binding protein PstS [Trueperaceae bacterium]
MCQETRFLSGTAVAQNVNLEGAGATFPAPLITAWADEYRDLTDGRVTVNYQSIGSGGGIRQFLNQTVMFGASERFLTDEQLSEVQEATGGTAWNLPVTLGSVVPTYNLPGVDERLVLDGPTLARLFLGEIPFWDDEAIQALNPDVNLPLLPVQIVHRSDGSGTTAVWTDYLSKVSESWAEQVGFATSVDWPTGIGGNGNEGVAGVVQTTPGALGYNSLVYASLNDIAYAAVVNASGNAIVADLATTSAAGDVDMPADTRVSITDTPAPDGYPAAGFAWLLVHERLEANAAIESQQQAEELIRFFLYVLSDGQDTSEPLDFARLPTVAVDAAFAMIERTTYDDEPIGRTLLEEHRAR